jgi:signal transduction histidine kinase
VPNGVLDRGVKSPENTFKSFNHLRKSSMKSSLRILHLAEDSSDAKRVRVRLELEGIACDLFRVETHGAFVSALEKGGFDLILANHAVTQFGVSALAIARERCPDLPFIFISDALTELAAFELLKGVIKRKRAEEEAEKDLRRIRALHEIDAAIGSTLDLPTVLSVLLEKIALFLPFASAATVRLLNRETGELESLACRGLTEEEWLARESRSLSERAKRVVETKAPLAVRNLEADRRSHNKEIYRKYRLVSYLGVPLMAKGEAIGVLDLYTKEEHKFLKEETDFLNTLAARAATAIDNTQLHEEIDLANRKLELTDQHLERSLKQLSILYTALAPLTPSESIHEMMGGIIERLMEATGADAGLIRIWDQQSGTYPIVGQRGFPEYYLKRVDVPPVGAVEWIVKHGEPIVAPDIASEPRFKEKMQLKLGLRSCAILPLKVRNEVRGIFHLSSRKLGHFDVEQENHLTAIARLMGIALENRHLFDELKASNVELEKANKIKDEFLSVMSHELRTPLNIVIGYAGMLKDGVLGQINETQEEALEKVLGCAADQLNMINTMMVATHIETALIALALEPLDLRDLLHELQSDYEAQAQKKNVRLICDYLATQIQITTDRAKVKQILYNLINNALKFTDEGTVAVSVQVLPGAPVQQGLDSGNRTVAEAAKRARWVEFRVTDTGIGIPYEMRGAIFEKFYQVDSSETKLYGGVGLGLYIVKKFTEFLGGTVEVESEVGKGSTFRVRIPVDK